MIAALAVAFAGAPTDAERAVQAVTEAAWRRQPVADVLAAGAGDDEPVVLARVRALGRLRDPEALAPLRALQEHPSDAVRREVAFALGLTPGAAPTVRAWLEKTPGETAFLERMLAEGSVRWQLVEALGRAGDASDVARLTAMIAEDWPYDDAAVRALLRLHRAGVDVGSARAALVDQVLAGDPRTVETTAQALARIGLKGVPSARMDALVPYAEVAPSGMARASLVKALLAALPDDSPHRPWLQQRAAWDVPLVRATAIEADTAWRLDRIARTGVPVVLGPEPPGLHGLLTDPDPWLRLAAIGALAWRTRTPEIDAWLAKAPPFERALGIRALGLRDDAAAADAGVPWPVRAAHLGASDDVEHLVTTAIGAKDGWADNLDLPGLRSAAVERLQALEVAREVAVRLLVSPDPAVREAAIGMLAGEPDKALVEELVLSLRVEGNGDVLRAGLTLLADWRAADRRLVTDERFLVTAIKRGLADRAPAVRAAAVRLRDALGLDLPMPPEDRQERELILPDGTVTTTKGDLPQLLELARIRGASITTTAGRFDVRLDPQTAPLAVHTFVQLARVGFYAQSRWHRIVPGFVAQGGCPRGDGWGGPNFTVVDEVSDERFTRGALGFARGDRDTAGLQIFVMTGPGRFLEGDYTWFGEVTSGMEVVRKLGPDDRISAIRVVVANGDD